VLPLIEELYCACIDRKQADKRVNRRGLARAVGPKEPQDLTLLTHFPRVDFGVFSNY
jgi:hypothetical protein